MFANSIRASRQSLVRAVARQSTAARRTFITPTAVRQADLVQDLYLKELKAYKTPAVKASDAEGQVQKFSIPKPPQSPEEANIQNELSAYESEVPEVEGQAEAGSSGAVEHDWFEEEPEEEAPAAHH